MAKSPRPLPPVKGSESESSGRSLEACILLPGAEEVAQAPGSHTTKDVVDRLPLGAGAEGFLLPAVKGAAQAAHVAPPGRFKGPCTHGHHVSHEF